MGGWDQWRIYVFRRAGGVITMVVHNINYELKIQPLIEISLICLQQPCQQHAEIVGLLKLAHGRFDFNSFASYIH